MTQRLACSIAVLSLALATPIAAQDNTSDTRRLVDQLKIVPGMTVAEIGAGTGELTVAVAKAVGTDGRVYSNELDRARHPAIVAAAERAGLSNVTVVESRPADANLPEACCDALFMRNVYHHFEDPAAMNASLMRSLKPGGRIAVIDFPPRNGQEAQSPADRDENRSHGISEASVEKELRAAGFEIVTSGDQRGNRWFMVIGRKP